MCGEGNRGDVTGRILPTHKTTHKTQRSHIPRRWRTTVTPLSLSSFSNPTNTSPTPLHPLAPSSSLQMSQACPFDQASDRHLTPPLSPSISSGSSRESSAPSSFSTSTSSHLAKGLHSYPDSQPLGHSNPVIELGRMPDGLGDDTVMLDEWEGEGKREEREHGKHLFFVFRCFSFFFSFFHSWHFRFVELTCVM